MKRIIIFFSIIWLYSPLAYALSEPQATGGDARIRSVNFDPKNIVLIIGKHRHTTQIIFGKSEVVIDVVLGNSLSWMDSVSSSKNSIFIKPTDKFENTSLTVVTQKGRTIRNYQFEIRALQADENLITYYQTVYFDYPIEAKNARMARARINAARSRKKYAEDVLDYHQVKSQKNWKYAARGFQGLMPDSVFDDGRLTLFHFPKNMSVPAIYAVTEGGQEELVPFSADNNGQLIKVQKLSRMFILRRGKEVLYIYNVHYDPQGVNPNTGTISPSVEREAQ